MHMFMEKPIRRQILALLFILTAMLRAVPYGYADHDPDEMNRGVIHADEIQTMFDRYLEENGLSPDLISVGYVYTETGESWYHNEDRWYYSASLYKVPLRMLYAEKEAAYFSWEYRAYSCFSARFMTEVMNTLYSEPERFPGIAERLKEAQPGHYFRLKLEDCGYEIAQKYGNYHDEDGNDWNHTAGILYTPNPVVLTVLTQYGGISEIIISDMAELFFDYTLKADAELSVLRQEFAKTEEPVPEEDEIPAAMQVSSEHENELPLEDADPDPEQDAGISEQVSDQLGSEHHRGILLWGLSAAVFAMILWGVIRYTARRTKRHTK